MYAPNIDARRFTNRDRKTFLLAHCKNCGKGQWRDATEVDTRMAGPAVIVRCKFCALTPARSSLHIDQRDDVPSEPISIEKARARTALAQQSLN
jgi:hypothetical protein